MGHRILALVGVVLVMAAFVLPSPKRESSLLVSASALDFGMCDFSKANERTLTLTNTSRFHLGIRFVADCNCVALALPAITLEPGEEKSISLKLNRSDAGELRDGIRRVRRELAIVTDQNGARQDQIIQLTGMFDERLIAAPSSLTLSTTAISTKRFEIGLSAQCPNAAPKIDTVSDTRFTSRLTWNEKYNAGKIHLLPQQDCLLSPCSFEVLLSLAGQHEAFSLPVQFQVEAPLSFEPSAAILSAQNKSVTLQGIRHPDLPPNAIVSIESIAEQPASIRISHDGLQCTVASSDAKNIADSSANVIRLGVRVVLGDLTSTSTVTIPVFLF